LPAARSGRNDERARTHVQVLAFKGCEKLDGLRHFESGLFRVGFLRETLRSEDPVPFELVDRLMASTPKLITYRKSDFEQIKTRGSIPYREIVNRYLLAACEEPGGGLFVFVVRHDPEQGDKFLGDRFQEALKYSACEVNTVAPPREIGFFVESTEDDLVRHIRRGRCRDYATGR
jgi:hypothetical protein